MANEQYDNLFATIAQGVRGIDNLMDAFFSFLSRKTDFYEAAEKDTTSSKDPALDVVLRSYDQHRAEAFQRIRRDRERNRKIDEERRRRAQKAAEEELKKKPSAEAKKAAQQISQIKAEAIKSAAEGSRPAQSNESTKPSRQSQEPVESSDDDGPAPVGNGGTTDKYTWTQQLKSLDVMMPVPVGTTARQCQITMTATKLKVVVKGEVLIDGDLHSRIKVDDSVWALVDQRLLQLTLEKADDMRWWSCVVIGDPEIDTRKIVPENSKLSELDPDLRQTVEKMMFDQDMKARGLPTSDQRKQAEILEKFRETHPELDFSNAKINWGNEGGGGFQQMM